MLGHFELGGDVLGGAGPTYPSQVIFDLAPGNFVFAFTSFQAPLSMATLECSSLTLSFSFTELAAISVGSTGIWQKQATVVSGWTEEGSL